MSSKVTRSKWNKGIQIYERILTSRDWSAREARKRAREVKCHLDLSKHCSGETIMIAMTIYFCCERFCKLQCPDIIELPVHLTLPVLITQTPSSLLISIWLSLCGYNGRCIYRGRIN